MSRTSVYSLRKVIDRGLWSGAKPETRLVGVVASEAVGGNSKIRPHRGERWDFVEVELDAGGRKLGANWTPVVRGRS